MEPTDFWPLNMTICARCEQPLVIAQAIAVSGPNGDGWAHLECPDEDAAA